ncbi:MAG: prenyltransferase [Candidatus Methanoliparum thermophilum]|uniref:Prenyltransferase n=1 Tax=Methanoliparum thermophilum TaxID=2491083 RepID=A0A520KS35_METT2|nr:MAG: prenyltransferase [Candidatus Methanoliparum thermophilum]
MFERSIHLLKGFWRLTRLEHGIILIIAVFIGAIITSKNLVPLDTFIYASLSVLCIEVGTFALNDYFDLDVDIKNKRIDRPLVSGDLKPRTAFYLSCFSIPLGVFFSIFLNWICFLIAMVNAIISVFYDFKFKKFKFVGNFYIAFTMAIPFIFGSAMITTEIPAIIYFISLIAFLSGIGREIMKDVMDIEGDILRDTRSFPMIIGKKRSIKLSVLFYLAAVILSLVPFIVNIDEVFFNNLGYLIIVAISDTLFIYISLRMLFKPDFKNLEFERRYSLVAMSIGLLAFLVGPFLG